MVGEALRRIRAGAYGNRPRNADAVGAAQKARWKRYADEKGRDRCPGCGEAGVVTDLETVEVVIRGGQAVRKEKTTLRTGEVVKERLLYTCLNPYCRVVGLVGDSRATRDTEAGGVFYILHRERKGRQIRKYATDYGSSSERDVELEDRYREREFGVDPDGRLWVSSGICDVIAPELQGWGTEWEIDWGPEMDELIASGFRRLFSDLAHGPLDGYALPDVDGVQWDAFGRFSLGLADGRSSAPGH